MDPIKLLPLHFTSYSSLNDLHSCPRYLELRKMGPEGVKVSSPHFAFGSAVGDGAQELLSGGSLEKAWVKAFMAWDCDFYAAHEKGKKSIAHALDAVKTFAAYSNIILQEWEIFTFEFKNSDGSVVIRRATELSAIVEFPDGFRYRIYIDVVLRHKKTGRLVVVELKTTGAKRIEQATYSNSNQALGYGVILDKIAPGLASYGVWYYVYGTGAEDWEFFEFQKSRLAKANWIRTVLHDHGTLQRCIESSYFPKHGESCFNFFSPCTFYGSCDMSNKSLYGGDATIEARIAKELAEQFDFRFTLAELLDQQITDIQHGTEGVTP